ncbi:LolA family protein [Telmatospirillum siberiense]|uniref:Outer membrane lipoprotein carrier protein LolA n=1 Tax=Telmatospirillum siberiense TaxID=382514 RepID=A0A2N3PN18_9PROT|nr:outer membrane lipoprotein carrier protein LolA [Telmatospirillum siberiense]PKU21792.1 outer membrane lipoprotein carrier protein LolA [Telmatospirillum siberiense]
MSFPQNHSGRAIAGKRKGRGWRLALAAALCSLSLTGPLSAAVPASAESADVEKAENYLNGITTFKAHFMQVNPDGATAEGTVYLWRPGRLRLDYDPPSPIEVVADGNFLIYYDKQLQQVSYLGLDSTPAGILVRPAIKLNGEDLKVTKVGHQPGIMNVTVIKAADPSQGRITLVFTESPFQLRQWQVTDPQGQVTTVSLFDASTGLTFDKDLFYFKDPKLGHGPDLSTSGR